MHHTMKGVVGFYLGGASDVLMQRVEAHDLENTGAMAPWDDEVDAHIRDNQLGRYIAGDAHGLLVAGSQGVRLHLPPPRTVESSFREIRGGGASPRKISRMLTHSQLKRSRIGTASLNASLTLVGTATVVYV